MKNKFKTLKEFLFFSQIDSMIKTGSQRPIEVSDTLILPEELQPKLNALNVDRISLDGGIPLLKSILISTQKELGKGSVYYFFSQVISLLTPVLIHQFIAKLESGNFDTQTLVALAISIGITGYLSGLFLQHYFYRALKLQQKIISMLNFKIFQKSLNLSAKARGEINSGDVVNLMSSDSESVSDIVFVVVQITANIFLVVSTILLLFYYFGLSTIAAILMMIVLLPISQRIAAKFNYCDENIMRLKDQRISLMGQILNAIRLIKYFAWESSIEDEVKAIRDQEVKARIALVKAETLSGLIYMASTSLVLLATLAAHAARGETISLSLIFAGLSLFALLEEPLGDMTNLIARWVNARVSAGRLVQFFNRSQNVVNRYSAANPPSLQFHEVSFSYNEKSAIFNMNFRVEQGEKVAIIGPVGSGKSTLLQLILREELPQHGKIVIDSFTNSLPIETAFVPQESYIINGTLEENITFGTQFQISTVRDEAVANALRKSCLLDDINQFQVGLQTEIGERGINLSGGQKQRVSLARAILKKPKLVLLDDPLSAVDAKTERKLINNLILQEWKNQTVIMVTHRLQYLNQFDRILFIEEGRVIFDGNYEALTRFSRFVAFYQMEMSEMSSVANRDFATAGDYEKVSEQNPIRITEEEDRERGKISKDLFFSYIRLLGGTGKYAKYVLLSLFMVALISKVFPLLQRGWLSFGKDYIGDNALVFLSTFAILGIVSLVFFYFNNIFWYYRGIRAAISAHDSMLKSVLRAPLRFFDATPVGRLLQRFSRDMDSIDTHLMFSHISAIDCFVQLVVSTLLIVFVMPITVVFIGPIIFAYYFIQRAYRETAREIKRLDSTARSPRYAHFKETLQGLLSIRTYHQQEWFTEHFFSRLLLSQKMFYNHYMVNRWFSVRVPLLGGLIVLTSSLSVVWAVERKLMGAASAGLVLVYALAFWRYLNWGVRILSDIEARMTSVERIVSLTQLKPEESKSNSDAGENLRDAGENLQDASLEFRNVNVRYAPHLPLVLKDISFKVESGQRVGLIGRTGSGKSTIFQALYRFIEVEEGLIFLGKVPTKKMSLDQLRKSIAIIPQDPSLFMGNLRSNLDRFGEYNDEKIYNVLKRVHLYNFVTNLPGGLMAKVAENGSNFSQGQRQLICLARALLIDAKLVVLDEATASVDMETDRLVQKVLKESLRGITQLVIAHRLETIRDADNIICLENGRITELSTSVEEHY